MICSRAMSRWCGRGWSDNASSLARRARRLCTACWTKRPSTGRVGRDVMREQLEPLITSVSFPRLTVQAIRSEDNPRSLGALTIATVDVGYVETAMRGIVTSSREDIIDLAAVWETF